MAVIIRLTSGEGRSYPGSESAHREGELLVVTVRDPETRLQKVLETFPLTNVLSARVTDDHGQVTEVIAVREGKRPV